LHPPHVYDFRRIPQLYGPVSDLVPSTPVFEMYPIGFTSLADYLEKAGWRVRIVNLAGRMLRDRRFDAGKFIQKLKAPLFGIDLHWLVHAHGALEIARLVRRHHPDAKIVLGGFSASYFWRELISDPDVDYVMRGDSTEEPMRLLLEHMKSGRLAEVPNLVWKNGSDQIHDNGLTHIPPDLAGIMGDHYGGVIRSVLRYRDLQSIIPFRGWLKQPVTAVFTARGCSRNCVFCGGSASAMRCVTGRTRAALRSPQQIHRDIQQISRFSRGLISVIGDIRQAGDQQAEELLRLLQQQPVTNRLMFEMYSPAPPELLAEMAEAAPGFSLDISPSSHDPAVRLAAGSDYSNQALEAMLEQALDLGAGRAEVFFMIGLPQQTRRSVMDTVNYCGHLLEKMKGDPRLLLFIGPLAPFLDPGSPGFENPQKHGYRLRYKTLAEHRQALTQPSWKHVLNYETEWLSRDDIMDVTYEAATLLTRLKAGYGQIAPRLAEAQIERIRRSRALEERIDAILKSGRLEELQGLKKEMDELNGFRAVQQRQMDIPLGLVRLRYLNSLWHLGKEALQKKPRA
jgi:B12-binding domain/radical SAM domain protein